MPWDLQRISNNKERAADAIRDALEAAFVDDKNSGRGYRSVASAVEQALQAFGNVNGYSIDIKTQGDISEDGKGYVMITLRTIDKEVIV